MTLPYVALGDLRRRWRQKETPIHSALLSRAGIQSVRTGSRPWTDTDTEVDQSRTEPRFLTSVRSFKAVRTDVISTKEQFKRTDVESVFLHVRTEPIGKIVAFTEPNRY